MLLRNVVLTTLLAIPTLGVNAEVEGQAGLELGYRKVDLYWNIAGNHRGCCPNVLSELAWSDVQAVQIKGYFNLIFSKHITLESRAAYGTILTGDNQDSDYISNNRTGEFSRSNNDASGGELTDLSVGLRFLLGRTEGKVVSRGVWVYSKMGYSYHEQNFVMREGYQTLSVDVPEYDLYPPPVGPFAGLKSSYETVWRGPWVGLAAEFALSESDFLSVEYQFHLAEYIGVGNWNLRSDFEHPKSFEHRADGVGHILDIVYKRQLSKTWGMGFGLLIENWKTDEGDAKYFYSNGDRGSTQLNEVIYSSSTLSFKADYTF